MRVVMRLQVRFGRVGHRSGQISLDQPQHRKAPAFPRPGDQRVGHRRRCCKAARHRALQQATAKITPQVGLELGLAQVVAVQRKAVSLTVESARGALEGVHTHQFIGHDRIADRQADPSRFVVQCRLRDQPLQHLLVDAEGQRLLGRDRLAKLLREGIDLGLQRARIVVGRDVHVADAADLGHPAGKAGDAKAAKAKDQHPHQHPDGGLLGLATLALAGFGRGRRHLVALRLLWHR